MDAKAETSKRNSSPEPSKWNLLAWIWWRLGERRWSEPELYFTSAAVGDWWIPIEVTPGADGGRQDGYGVLGLAERSNESSAHEPSKRNLLPWIWWKLGEPSPDDGSKPVFSSLDEYRTGDFPGYRP
jgi:hypothetical protein